MNTYRLHFDMNLGNNSHAFKTEDIEVDTHRQAQIVGKRIEDKSPWTFQYAELINGEYRS